MFNRCDSNVDENGRVFVICEEYLNETEGWFLGEGTGWYEPFTGDNKGRLFRYAQREYGRCVSKMYEEVDSTWRMGGLRIEQIGWVFQRTEKYEDCDKTYVREVWLAYAYVTCAKCVKEEAGETVLFHEHQWKRLSDAAKV